MAARASSTQGQAEPPLLVSGAGVARPPAGSTGAIAGVGVGEAVAVGVAVGSRSGSGVGVA